MQNSNSKAKLAIEKRSRIVKSGNKSIQKSSHHAYLRLTPRLHEMLKAQNKATGLSINSLVSICIELQLQSLPSYKVNRIEVRYTDNNGIQKQVNYSGNCLNTVSNFKKQ